MEWEWNEWVSEWVKGFDRVLIDHRVAIGAGDGASKESAEGAASALRGAERASKRSDRAALGRVANAEANDRSDARSVSLASDFAARSPFSPCLRRRFEENSLAVGDRTRRCSNRSGATRRWR